MAYYGRNQKKQPSDVTIALTCLALGYFLCWMIQVPGKPKVPAIRRILPEEEEIPHGPSRTPQGRCCCSSGGICFGDTDFDIMFNVNATVHPERFVHISGPREEAGFSAYPTFRELHQIIYRTEMNLYENFNLPQGVTRGGDDTHVNDQAISMFKRLLGRPARLIVEVGSGLGNSAVRWGQLVKENNGLVVCFDTWEGDLSQWFSEAWREVMAWQDGGPHLYERFLDRIVSNGLTDTVLPIKVQSTTGARMLQVLNYTVDGIYLDAAQEGGEFYLDLMYYWDILTPGGVLMGDDYMWYWPGIIHDVDLFMRHKGLGKQHLHFSDDWHYWTGAGTWALKKPLEPTHDSVSIFRKASDGNRS